jgi:nitrite reductase/ring-hydroxylating ferredoxin subunit
MRSTLDRFRAVIRTAPAAPSPEPNPQGSPRLPYPDGWFAVAFSSELGLGQVRRTVLMGEEIVLYRTASGVALAVDPYCPHLGAHLGVGGKVEGEDLVCPFHRFAFGPDGSCVRTGYGTPPPKARLSTRLCEEHNGAVFVWRHAQNAPPKWQIPDVAAGPFGVPVRHKYTIVDHPQELVENAIDIGHIAPVHHYERVRVRSPFEPEGHRFRIGPAAERRFPGLGLVDVVFDVEAHGLGFITVTASIPRLRMRALFQMMSTPLTPVRLDVRFCVSLAPDERTDGRARTGLSRHVSTVVTRLLAPFFWRDIQLDFPIWENKVYLERPRLAKGDGPVGAYRRWAAQFYTPPITASPNDTRAQPAPEQTDGSYHVARSPRSPSAVSAPVSLGNQAHGTDAPDAGGKP